MDRTPLAERFRLMAMASYLPGVALVWLFKKDAQEVRLIRFHAYQAIALWIWLLAILSAGSLFSSLIGGVPELGFWINVSLGLIFLITLPALVILSALGALAAFQGSLTHWPLLSDWARDRAEGRVPVRSARKKKRARPKRRLLAPTGENEPPA